MSAAGDINRSRDLYVAFAFAAADLLVEVEEDGRIGFAVGAAMALAGKPARLLSGLPLAELFIPEDAERISRALIRIDRGERVRHMLLHTPGRDETHPSKPVALSGYRHPQRAHARLIALSHAAALETPAEAHDPITGLLDKDGFTDLARRMLSESSAVDATDAYQLTMLEVPQVEKVRAEAGPLAADEFMAELGDRLRACSVGGDAAGELGDNKYGLIHAPNVTADAIESTIGELLHAFLPPPPHQSVFSASMTLDGAGVSSEEAANALIYSLNAFSRGGSMTLDDLTTDLRPRLSETVAQMREIKTVIDTGGFELVFQPVVDLWTGVVHHFECLVRFPGRDSPFETVTFAENVGMVGGLDLAILRRAIDFMRSTMGKHDALRFAVNLSGRSLSHIGTARQLLEIVREAIDLRGRLLFELTESAEVEDLPAVNGVLQMLRRQGFPVCLDDFGAGAAAFHYLRALQVDHVKIDGSYVREISANGESTPFLRAIAQLCRDLKVGTIAEFVENTETTNLLKLLKVRFGQGYHFGKPISPRPAADVALRGWAVDNMEWQNGLLICRTAL
ncbi:EAL domain-containing protein [Magnetospirillum aberrantis]|uniref:EAL domain-containing protein n=1 Tax=Magnetospirillum aberrantis SpK TaxID=908842 RepID=A0A7C9UV06_9PROT|nr:EAL domain-containing protein [Magnetospirillum aberrantis]NFV81267.1 EAL domain-containing protein [Magnetospirillum aberrantis SpK]